MLERVALFPEILDLGSIAEAIVYYGNVEFVCFNGHVADMVERIGMDATIRLAESDLINFTYKLSALSLDTNEGSFYKHSVYELTPTKTVSGKRIDNAEDELAETFRDRFGRGVIPFRDVRRLGNAMSSYASIGKASGDHLVADIQNERFLTDAVQIVMRSKVPNYPEIGNITASASVSGHEFNIHSNIDFHLASQLFSKATRSPEATIGSAYLAVQLLSMAETLLYAGDRKCDMWADAGASSLLQLRVESLARRLQRGKTLIQHFEEEKFLSRSFSAAIEGGHRTFADVLAFAESTDTRKFKKWIAEAPEGRDLLAEYEKSRVASSKLAASLPVQATKRVVFATAGFALDRLMGGDGVVGGLSAALANEFALNALDKLLASQIKVGWKPEQWVTQSATPFLR